MASSRLFKLLSLSEVPTKSLLRVAGMGVQSSRPASAPARTVIQHAVESDCVVIFSKTTCGYCGMAKRVFEGLGQPYTAVEVNKREDGDELQDALRDMTGARSVPRVFINGACIGGGTETVQLHKEGKLLDLLKTCHAQKES